MCSIWRGMGWLTVAADGPEPAEADDPGELGEAGLGGEDGELCEAGDEEDDPLTVSVAGDVVAVPTPLVNTASYW